MVLPTPIPDKGAVLTGLSLWWFGQLRDLVPDHLVTADVAEYPSALAPYADELRGRSMLCRRLDMQPVECVARGYLAGSGLVEYRATGAVCGVPLPDGLEDGSALPGAGLHARDQGRARRARRERPVRRRWSTPSARPSPRSCAG